MNDFERFAKALAMTESNDEPTAWGDQGLAMGRWQMHPAWYHDWADPKVAVRASWDNVFLAALLRFYQKGVLMGWSPIVMAMTFHLGHPGNQPNDWDEAYGVRFIRFYAQLGTPETPAKGN